jgi:outer membrane protein insertion porin family
VSPRVSFAVTRLNVFGSDHTLTLSAHVGRLQQRGLISYEAPRWLNSPHWKLTFTAFYDDTVDVTTFTSERLEGSVQAEEVLSKASTIEYRFTYRRVLASNLPPNLSLVPQLSQPTRVGGPGFIYIRDHRDNALESTKGTYFTLDGSVADSYFGSQRDFSRILGQHSSYYAFGKNRPQEKKFVFARSTRIGVETPFGNTVLFPPGQCPGSGSLQCIPLPELFLSGGGNSHRGFGLNQAGPRDPNTGFPLGGGALFLNNLELRFPAVALPFVHDNLSFALFHDAGNVFTNGRVMVDNLLRWSQKNPQLCLQASTASQCDYSYVSQAIGLGVRYKTPIGPVRFDFGYNLNPPAFPSHTILPDGTQGPFVPEHAAHFNVFFSIGQTF